MKSPSISQRAIMVKRPWRLPVGSVRTWQDGVYVKVSRTHWRKQKRPFFTAKAKALLAALPPAAAKDQGGFAGLARAIAAADGSQGRDLAWLASKAAGNLAALEARPQAMAKLALPLPKAMAMIAALGPAELEWQLYAARRIADFNDGVVDMAAVPAAAEAAKKFHSQTQDDRFGLAKAYAGPMTVADINLASWMQFFAEGGQLNQPAWLETNRLKDLRHQFENLAVLHGANR